MINSDSIANVSIVGFLLYAIDGVINWLGSTQHIMFLGFMLIIFVNLINGVITHKYKMLVYRSRQKKEMVDLKASSKEEMESMLEIEPFHKGARNYIKKMIGKK